MKKKMFESLLDLNDYFRTEKQCIEYFIKMRWNGKITCPYKNCESNEFEVENNKIYVLKSKKDFKCSCCGKTFSYKTGTVFENSKISMKKWFMAIYLQTAHKKGLSSPQLGKYIKVRQGTAWFMLQRLKYITQNNFFNDSFSGIVEADEAYIGGKSENKHMKQRIKLKEKNDKAIVLGIVNRDTKQVKAFKVETSKYYELGQKIMDNVDTGSTLITDEYSAYTLLRNFYNHETINHSQGEYVKNDKNKKHKTHTNTIEGFWSMVKRTINGTHHWISKKHLQNYLSEMSFRYNTREFEDADRFNMFLSDTNGRLKYSVLVA